MTIATNILSVKYFNTPKNLIDENKYLRQDGTLAINVKWRYPHLNQNFINSLNEEELEAFDEIIKRVFWWKANKIAISYGYATCYSVGRSDGWAQPMLYNKTNESLSDKVKPLQYYSDNFEIEYLAQIKTFLLFAEDVESLFNLIDKEIRRVSSPDDLDKLTTEIHNL